MGAVVSSVRKTEIDGVVVLPLKQFADERGKVMHMINTASPLYERFGEIYFSTVKSSMVKAWKKHRQMVQHIAVPIGRIRCAIYDDRPGSLSRGILNIHEIGEDNYALVRIPPLLWYGFKGIADCVSLIANCTDMPHNSDEQEILDPSDPRISYQW